MSFAAPDVHGQEPPDTGEDTTPPVVMITIDAITSDSASFSFVANEDGATLETLLAVDGVKGEWEDAAAGTKTYTGLEPGDYVFYVKATDLDGNAATYIKKFTIEPSPTIVTAKLEGSDNGARDDRLKVVAGTATAAGAAVKLFKINDNGNRVFLRGATLGDNGNVRVVIPDKNGREDTKYVAKVEPTANTMMDWTNNLRVR